MSEAERDLLLAMAKAICGRIYANRDIERLNDAIKAVEKEIKAEKHL